MIQKHYITFFSFFIASFLLAWGPTGHRTTAEIAEQYLSKRAKRKIYKLLDQHSMAYWANYADAIRSDENYTLYEPWHYVNFQYGENYLETPTNPKGDIYHAIQTCISILKDNNESKENQAFHLKLLIHFIGDLHQPLHVGHSEDLGGNTIKVEWFWTDSNLHRVWDEGMIDIYKMSYTELAHSFSPLTKEKHRMLEKGTIIDWMNESKELSEKVVYPSVDHQTKLNYRYMYLYFPIVESQLEKGGVRLAKILNEIFS